VVVVVVVDVAVVSEDIGGMTLPLATSMAVYIAVVWW